MASCILLYADFNCVDFPRQFLPKINKNNIDIYSLIVSNEIINIT